MYTYHSMSITAPRINMKEEDDNLGPSIRHPSGDVCLDILYLKEKNDNTKLSSAAKLYQTIMEYVLSKERTQIGAFKGNDIAYWILDHNQCILDIRP
jgi:hypothetical protein